MPNLNVELINRANLFRLVIDFLARSNIGNSIATILEHVKRVFNIDPADIMNKLFTDAVLAETTVKIVLRTLVEADWHDRKVAEEALLKYTMNSQLAKHVAYVAHLLFAELILPQRLQNALFFLLSFPDSVSTVETANNCFRNRRSFLNRYDRQLNSFIASNWNTLGESIMATST